MGVTDELRVYINMLKDTDEMKESDHATLIERADRVDAEVSRRVKQANRDARKAMARYMRQVIADYERGIKRVRKGSATEVVRCRDCMFARSMDCTFTRAHNEYDQYRCKVWEDLVRIVKGDDYCSLGERRDDDE